MIENVNELQDILITKVYKKLEFKTMSNDIIKILGNNFVFSVNAKAREIKVFDRETRGFLFNIWFKTVKILNTDYYIKHIVLYNDYENVIVYKYKIEIRFK